jgi:regulator of protease activity HflC (stomatin/prohibitin superfamily)
MEGVLFHLINVYVLLLLMVGLFFLYCMFRMLVVVVPSQHIALVERYGTFHRTIKAGVHIVIWPLEALREVLWTNVGQNGRVRTSEIRYFSLRECQLDVPPYDCLTQDGINVSFDCTCMYRVTSAKDATYKIDDALGYVQECIKQSVRNIVSRKDCKELLGRDDAIGTEICNFVNDTLDQLKCGIEVRQILVQRVCFEEKWMKARNKQITQQAEHEANRQRIRNEQEIAKVEMETRLNRITCDRKIQEAELSMEKQRLDANLSAALAKSENEAACKRETGMTPEFTVRLEEARIMASALRAPGRVLIAPFEYLRTPHYRPFPTHGKQEEDESYAENSNCN